MKAISILVLSTAMWVLAQPSAWAGPVNINSADATALAAELTGVGPALAQAIIKDRQENGPYRSPDALTRVKGIGPRIIELNKGNILVSDPASKH